MSADEVLPARTRRRGSRTDAPKDRPNGGRRVAKLGRHPMRSAVLRARIRSEIWPVLTTEQQEKAKQLRSLKGKREKRRIDALERWLQNG